MIAIAVVVTFLATPATAFYDPPADPEAGDSIKVIVIDPGHGGLDHGAIGPTKLKEKEVVLSVAWRLAKALKERLKAKVYLTRDDDTYLSLKQRTEYANSVHADIFISIHTNAAYRKKARGVETFFLSLDASDDDARETAAFENNVINMDNMGNDDSAAFGDDLKAILWDLTQTGNHHESARLAETIQGSLHSVVGGENRGVKQAPFYVLYGATMPAVLVEIGFISNPIDEKRLSTGKARGAIASALADAIVRFNNDLKRRTGLVELEASD